MRKLIYRKADLVFVGAIQSNTDYEWELKHNVIPNFGGNKEDYAEIETNIKRPILKMVDNKVVVEEKKKSKDEMKKEKEKELKQKEISASDLLEHLISEKIVNKNRLPVGLRETIEAKGRLKQELLDL